MNLNRVDTKSLKQASFSILSLFTERQLTSYTNLATLSYHLYRNKLYVDYTDLDWLRKKIMAYEDEYKVFMLEKELERDLNKRFDSDDSSGLMSNLDVMTGDEFEKSLLKLFRKLDFKAELTLASGDQGADLLLYKNNVSYAVQAKRYSTKVGNKAVQEVIAGRLFYQTEAAIVVTTNYFTPSAIELARKSKVIIWDRDNLLKQVTRLSI